MERDGLERLSKITKEMAAASSRASAGLAKAVATFEKIRTLAQQLTGPPMMTFKSDHSDLRGFAAQIAYADSTSPKEVFNDLKRKALKL